MKELHRVGSLWICLFALAIAPTARAAVVTYSDPSSFNAALDSDPSIVKAIEGYDSLPNGTQFTTLSGINYSVTDGVPTVTDTSTISPPNALGRLPSFCSDPCFIAGDADTPPDTLTLSFPTPIVAFGASFLGGYQDGDYEIATNIGDVASSLTYSVGGYLRNFAGLISDQEFSSVTISVTRPFTFNWVLDDMTFATAAPIPPALWLFGSGLFGLIGIARRKVA